MDQYLPCLPVAIICSDSVKHQLSPILVLLITGKTHGLFCEGHRIKNLLNWRKTLLDRSSN